MKRPGPLRRRSYLKPGQPIQRRQKPLNRVSKKRQKLARASAGMRRKIVNEAGCCAICGHSSRDPWPDKPLACSKVVCHEISNGKLRGSSLDKPFCLIAICRYCNEYVVVDKSVWPEARQLCLLMFDCPERYDLHAYLTLTSPRAMQRITQAEVEAFLPSMP